MSEDPFWQAAEAFLAAHLERGESVVGPDGIGDRLGEYYLYEYKELCAAPDFLLVHKGRIEQLGPAYLRAALDDMHTSFFNEVFVILSRRHIQPFVPNAHFRALMAALRAAEAGAAGVPALPTGIRLPALEGGPAAEGPPAENPYSLLRAGRYLALEQAIADLYARDRHHPALLEFFFRGRYWDDLYRLTAETLRLRPAQPDDLLFHAHACAALGRDFRHGPALLHLLEHHAAQYDSRTLRILDLAAQDEATRRAVERVPLLRRFQERHCLRFEDRPLCPARPLFEAEAPVDAVFTWVDPEDPAWQARFEAHGHCRDEELSGRRRYVNIGEIYTAIASVAKNIGFLRHIHVVTDRQEGRFDLSRVPAAVRAKLRFVDHTEILGGLGIALPTFNSCVIESQLHRIPGLSEVFLYLNDDCFIGQPVAREELVRQGVCRMLANHKVWKKEDISIREGHYSSQDAATARLFLGRFGYLPGFSQAHQMRISTRIAFEETNRLFAAEMATHLYPNRVRDYDSIMYPRLNAWVAYHLGLQAPDFLHPADEVNRIGIGLDLIRATQRQPLKYYSLNNLNQDSRYVFDHFSEVLLGHDAVG